MPASSNSDVPHDATSVGSPSENGDVVNILLVDDDPKNLTVLETVLDSPGYRLISVESADQALLALVREEFALIVLDIQMPGMTGFELATLIKQRKKTAGVPIIFLTAFYSEAEDVIAGYDSGAVDYLHKPVNPPILRSKVAVFAALHRKTKEAERANHSLLAEIAERRRIEEQLLQLNNQLEQRVEQRNAELLSAHRRKDVFLATLSHELRNPLAPIRNGLEILKSNRADADTTRQIIEVMDRQLHHLIRLVDDLLDVARIIGDKFELRKQKVELSKIVAGAIEIVRPMITDHGHKLEVTLPQEPLFVEADPVRLTQVLGNLLANATKYTEPLGRIGLVAERDNEDIVVGVRDSGIGISAEILPHVFELFVQADQTTTRSQGGLGIGLTLVKNLVEMHGGIVTAASEGLGKGSEFVVRLPLASQRGQSNAANAGASQKLQLSSHRLLVVDDNQAAATTLAMLLRLQGHDVRIAHDGPSALEIAQTFLPEMVFLDIGMPKMDGYEVARRMRALPELQNTRLAAVTGWGQEEDRRRSAEAGFDYHLVKPADIKEVGILVAKLNPKDLNPQAMPAKSGES